MITPAADVQMPALLLTPRDTAKILAISERSLARMAARGEIQPVRLGAGRIVRYPIESIKKLAAASMAAE